MCLVGQDGRRTQDNNEKKWKSSGGQSGSERSSAAAERKQVLNLNLRSSTSNQLVLWSVRRPSVKSEEGENEDARIDCESVFGGNNLVQFVVGGKVTIVPRPAVLHPRRGLGGRRPGRLGRRRGVCGRGRRRVPVRVRQEGQLQLLEPRQRVEGSFRHSVYPTLMVLLRFRSDFRETDMMQGMYIATYSRTGTTYVYVLCIFYLPQINCYLKEEAGEERKLDGSTTGWKGEGCESPKRKEKPGETGAPRQ